MVPSRKLCLLAAACLCAAACSSAPKPQANSNFLSTSGAQPVSSHADKVYPLDVQGYNKATDPTAEALQDISGEMLLYYATAHRMPQSIAELSAFSDEPLNFISPISHEQYVYRPIQLTGTSSHPELVMYDPQPMRDGTRWGIVGAPPYGDRPAELWVVQFDDKQMKIYNRAATPLKVTGENGPTNRPLPVPPAAATQP